MIDPQKLLDDFLGTGSAARGGEVEARGRQSGLNQAAGGGSVQDQIGGLLGGQGGSALKGALAGGLATYLLGSKRGRKLGKKAVTYGGMALVAGLAYKAWQNHQANKAGVAPQHAPEAPRQIEALPATEGTVFQPTGREGDERARLILSAMIAAAKADGYIDSAEQAAIFTRIDEIDLDPEAKGILMDEMRRPLSIGELVEKVSSEEVAMEVYTASLLAIDPDHPAERAYLDMLAARLGLAEELVAEIRRTADAAQE
ncbi:tellurite resistance TerB family protein [Afifella pfennigii]|uniref:tellurite resistance TerB family protein n=1 Tax=Afifella pfennigii TaxID=209897 RepID=UPI00047E0331|nr:tellurite resistance TerB family protein [Afifella pfennigii]